MASTVPPSMLWGWPFDLGFRCVIADGKRMRKPNQTSKFEVPEWHRGALQFRWISSQRGANVRKVHPAASPSSGGSFGH